MIRLADTGCYWIKGVGHNMKWNRALNAEQSGLMAMGLTMYGSIAEARKAEFHYIDPDGGAAKHELVVAEAEYIMNAIWDEIQDVWRGQELGEDMVSSLEVATKGSHDGGWDSVSKDQCRFSKESLALWFYEMEGLDRAQLFSPHFYPKFHVLSIDDPGKATFLNAIEKPLSTKTENKYLVTIKALSLALVGTSTGQYHTDAKNILDDLACKGIPEPVDQRTLVKYLKKANES